MEELLWTVVYVDSQLDVSSLTPVSLVESIAQDAELDCTVVYAEKPPTHPAVRSLISLPW